MSRSTHDNQKRLAILGAGSLGQAIAHGLVRAQVYEAGEISLTRRHLEPLAPLAAAGFVVRQDNSEAVQEAQTVLVAQPPSGWRCGSGPN